MRRTWIVVGIAALLLWVTAEPVRGDEAQAKRAEALWARAIAAEEERDVEAEDALVALGEAAVPALVEALGSSRSWPRTRAAELLERLGPRASEAVPALIDALYDRTWTTRRQAAYALSAMGDAGRAALPVLWRAARQPPQLANHPKDEASDHDAYAWALLRLDGDTAETAREILLRRRVNDVLQIYLDTDPDRLRLVLTPLLVSESWRVRSKAIWTLQSVVWKLGEREPWLGILGDVIASDPAPSVRRSAVRVANRLIVQNGVVLESSLLVPALASDDPELRILAAGMLAGLTPSDAATVAALVDALSDAEPAVRRGACLALGRTGRADLRSSLAPLLDDNEVARAAAVALVGLGRNDADVLTLVAEAAVEDRVDGSADGPLFIRPAGRRLRAAGRSVDLAALAEAALLHEGGAGALVVAPHLAAREPRVRERALILLARLGKLGLAELKHELESPRLEARREAAAALVFAGVHDRGAVGLLLDAAVEQHEDVEVHIISDEIDWRGTAIALLAAADPAVVPDVVHHARCVLPEDQSTESRETRVAAKPRALGVHAAVLYRLGAKARPALEATLDQILEEDRDEEATADPLVPWLRHVLQTLPPASR